MERTNNHFDDCYSCMTKNEGYSKKEEPKMEYLNISQNAELTLPTSPLYSQGFFWGFGGDNNASSDRLEKH